jgi:hypothetical protein
MDNDSALNLYTSIDNSKEKQGIVVGHEWGKKRIKPRDTKQLICIFSDGSRIVGFPADSCWLFKVVKGKINGYSFLPIKSQNITAIQAGDNAPIIPLTLSNLLPLIAEDPKAKALAQKGKLVKALNSYNGNN